MLSPDIIELNGRHAWFKKVAGKLKSGRNGKLFVGI